MVAAKLESRLSPYLSPVPKKRYSGASELKDFFPGVCCHEFFLHGPLIHLKEDPEGNIGMSS